MIKLSRADDSMFGQWWWTIDRTMFFAFILMIAFGLLLMMAATPMVATRIGLEEFYFIKRHLIYILPSLFIIFIVSNLDENQLKKFSLVLFFSAVILTFLTLFFGAEIKGARRWISLAGFSIQPSEFAKPALTILTAWMFANQKRDNNFNGFFIASGFLAIFSILLILQPDIGMLIVTLAVWGCQLFINGLPIFFVIIAVAGGVGGFILAYMFLPHVTARVNKFLDPAVGDHYQINRSLEAFSNGGLFGVGPGEGMIKRHLPDAHADFVFAVLGEEFGFIFCLILVLIIGFIVVYGMLRAMRERDHFTLLASVGLLTQFGLQSFINMASTLHLIPTKGMTLPFISYGGSSMIAISIAVGMILALGRRKISDRGVSV